MASIEIIGDDGYTLIDDKYKNLIVVDSFRSTFPVVGGAVRGSYVDVYYTSLVNETPFLAVSSTFPTVLGYYQKTNNSHQWRVYCSSAGVNGTCEFYILSLPQVISNLNGLVQIFNAAGEIVFDSNHNYCQSLLTFSTTMANDTSVAIPAGRKCAHIMSIPSYTFSALPASGGSAGLYETNIIYTFCGIYFTSSLAVATRFTYSQQQVPLREPPRNSGQTNNDAFCVVIDVTNIPILRSI